MAKIDYAFNERNTLTAHWFAGQGNQVAPVGSSLLYYYEVAPIHVQNYAIVYNRVISNSIANQLLLGVNYFNQVFNDFETNFDAASLGLVTGSTLPGAPNIKIRGFDPIGETPPEGRNDITGHLTDDLSWTVGKHQFKFGGEFARRSWTSFTIAMVWAALPLTAPRDPRVGGPPETRGSMPCPIFLPATFSPRRLPWAIPSGKSRKRLLAVRQVPGSSARS